HSSGRQLGRSEITSTSQVTGAVFGDGTNPLILPGVVVNGTRPIVAKFAAALLTNGTAGGHAIARIQRRLSGGAYVTIGSAYVYAPVANGGAPGARDIPMGVLAAGTYDFKIQLAAGVAGQVATLWCDAGTAFGPASLRVVEE
ncbi:MAG: hypothetical protein M3450_17460, partial [Actinomycetota bacterium]|nr:hypothetical protein [Actinomycetota bacterium]